MTDDVKEEREIFVRIKEEEIPIEINRGVSVIGRNVKEEEIPVEITRDEVCTIEAPPPYYGGGVKTERLLPPDLQEGNRMKVDVKDEREEMKVEDYKICKEEETSMEIGTDGQYMRSQERIAAIPQSREEKLEILKGKLLSMNGGLRRGEGGCFPSNPRRDPSNPGHMTDRDADRIGHTDWCVCGNCIPLSSGRESVCCLEIRDLRPFLHDLPCVTRHPYFPYLCENPDFTRIHRDMMRGRSHQEEDTPRSLRKAAYQAFSVWIYGSLEKKGERPIPACIVHRVRSAFRGPDCKDYPAEDMIFC